MFSVYCHAKKGIFRVFTLPSLHSSNPCDFRKSGPLSISWAHPVKIRMNCVRQFLMGLEPFRPYLYWKMCASHQTARKHNHREWHFGEHTKNVHVPSRRGSHSIPRRCTRIAVCSEVSVGGLGCFGLYWIWSWSMSLSLSTSRIPSDSLEVGKVKSWKLKINLFLHGNKLPSHLSLTSNLKKIKTQNDGNEGECWLVVVQWTGWVDYNKHKAAKRRSVWCIVRRI